jgi:hypothetical protein
MHCTLTLLFLLLLSWKLCVYYAMAARLALPISSHIKLYALTVVPVDTRVLQIDYVVHTYTVWLNRHPAGAEPIDDTAAKSLSNAAVTCNLTATPVAVEKPLTIKVAAPSSTSSSSSEAHAKSDSTSSVDVSAGALQEYTWEFGEVGAVHSDSSSESGSDDSADDSNSTAKELSTAQQSALHSDSKATAASANDDADDNEQLEKHEIRMQLPLAALQAAAGAATSFELVFGEHTAPVIRKLASSGAV